MSSQKKPQSPRANGAKSHGPSSPEGKQRSSQNALQHSLLARCVVLEGESLNNFELLMQQHVRRFQPADGVEFGMVEEMCAAYWRLHRAWAVETRMLDNQISNQPPSPTRDPLDHIADAFNHLAASPGMALLQRYQARLHLISQRALRNLILLRTIGQPNEDPPNEDLPFEPSPISAHTPNIPDPAPAPAPAADSKPLDSSRFRLHGWSLQTPRSAAVSLPAEPPLARPAPPISINSGRGCSA